MKTTARLGLVMLAITLCACPSRQPASVFPSAAAALDTLEGQFQCANGVQAEGKIDHLSEQGRVRAEVLLFAVNPARLRFDVVSPFGATLFTLASNGRAFRMVDLKDKRFIHGPASACNLARLTQVPLEGHVLVSLLRGQPPLLIHEPKQLSMRWEDGAYHVVVPSERQAEQHLELEVHSDDVDLPWKQQRLLLRRLRTAQAGRTIYEAQLRRHAPAVTAPARVDPDGLDPDLPPSGGACTVEVPRSIRFIVPSTGHDVVVSFDKVALNPPLPAGAFSLVTPGGVTPELVLCQ